MEGEEIDFDPRENDVVSTKLRTWNLKHPGNLFYTDLVNSSVSEVQGEDIADFKRVAEKIVHIIHVERNGRFLKLKDGDINPTKCTILNHKPCVSKVIHALRTAQIRREITETTASSTKKKKSSDAKGSNAESNRKRPLNETKGSSGENNRKVQQGKSRSRRSSGAAPELIAYKAQEGSQPVSKYILDAISAVCNQTDPEYAHRILDTPINGYTIENEPEKERLMRLQIRHRFAAAAAIGMSPLEFAEKLLKLWGGKLIVTKLDPPPVVPATPVSQSTLGEGMSTPHPAEGTKVQKLDISSSANPAAQESSDLASGDTTAKELVVHQPPEITTVMDTPAQLPMFARPETSSDNLTQMNTTPLEVEASHTGFHSLPPEGSSGTAPRSTQEDSAIHIPPTSTML